MGVTVGEMVEILGWLRKPVMTSVRKIAELTGEKIVVKIDGPIEERIAAKIANSTDEKIGERIGSSIGARIEEKIAKWIGERIIDQMRAGNSVDLTERIMSPGDMVVKGERMPG